MSNDCDDILKTLEAASSKVSAIRLQATRLISTYERISGQNQTVGCMEIAGIADSIRGQTRRVADKMYRYSDLPTGSAVFDSEEEIRAHLFCTIDQAIDGITANIEDDAIYIRTPLLYSRGRSKSNDPILAHSIQAYADGVSRAIELATGLASFDRSKFSNKTIFYLFVLDAKSPHIDNDNYDTTAITNRIVSHLYGGDSPLTCRMVYDSVRSDTLASGTYITVLPGRDRLPDISNIIKYWASKG